MLTTNKDAMDLPIEVGSGEYKEWNSEMFSQVDDFIRKESGKRTPEQRLKIEIQSIKFQMEEYLASNDVDKMATIDNFLNAYLHVLQLPLRQFAIYIDTTDGNLKKYIKGERKFNTDLAMKFGNFFHTSPELWLKVSLKNELLQLYKEKKQVGKYKKYDYRKLLEKNKQSLTG